ncbi:hypothetical protein HYY75_11490, partial [bacterium]|nr:hypothetical protein [bacterium]
MTDTSLFSQISATVKSRYPAPIAGAFQKLRNTPEEDLGGRQKSLIDLFEVFIKFLTVLFLQEARKGISNLREMLPQREKTFEFLKKPSLGSWIRLLRTLSEIETPLKSVWISPIAKWFKTPKSQEFREVFQRLEGIPNLNFEPKSKTPIAEICNSLVTYRNKYAHGAHILPEEMERRLLIVEHVIAVLLSSASFLEDFPLVHVEKIELAPDDSWKVHSTKFMGNQVELFTFTTVEKLDLFEVYSQAPRTSDQQLLLKLSPFMLCRAAEGMMQKEIFLFNSAGRSDLEYLSYSSGNYYIHKELLSDFNDLVELKFKPGQEEDRFKSLSP